MSGSAGANAHEVFDPRHVFVPTVPDDGWGRLSTTPVVGENGRVFYHGSWPVEHPNALETLQETKA